MDQYKERYTAGASTC